MSMTDTQFQAALNSADKALRLVRRYHSERVADASRCLQLRQELEVVKQKLNEVEASAKKTSCEGMINYLVKKVREAGNIDSNSGGPLVSDSWHDTHELPAFIGQLHREVSGLLTAFYADDVKDFLGQLADVMIMTLHCAGAFTDNMSLTFCERLDAQCNKK